MKYESLLVTAKLQKGKALLEAALLSPEAGIYWKCCKWLFPKFYFPAPPVHAKSMTWV